MLTSFLQITVVSRRRFPVSQFVFPLSGEHVPVLVTPAGPLTVTDSSVTFPSHSAGSQRVAVSEPPALQTASPLLSSARREICWQFLKCYKRVIMKLKFSTWREVRLGVVSLDTATCLASESQGGGEEVAVLGSPAGILLSQLTCSRHHSDHCRVLTQHPFLCRTGKHALVVKTGRPSGLCRTIMRPLRARGPDIMPPVFVLRTIRISLTKHYTIHILHKPLVTLTVSNFTQGLRTGLI